MKKYFLIDKRDGRTRLILDDKLKDKDFDTSLFDIVEINITKQQEDDIKQGKQKAVIENNELSLKNFNI